MGIHRKQNKEQYLIASFIVIVILATITAFYSIFYSFILLGIVAVLTALKDYVKKKALILGGQQNV